MLDKINNLLVEISSAAVTDPEELESFRLRFLSKKGLISELLKNSEMYLQPIRRRSGKSLIS